MFNQACIFDLWKFYKNSNGINTWFAYTYYVYILTSEIYKRKYFS